MIGRLVVLAAAALPLLTLGGCELAPRYHPATMALPSSYAGVGDWRRAHPDADLPRGPWWTAFGNATLDALEARLPANPALAAEAERFLQARDLAVEAESGLYPHLGANFGISENRQSPDRLFRSPTSAAPFVEASIEPDAAASWEIDIWGRIRDAGRARRQLAQAASADLASLDLSLQAELADDYILLRGLDGEAEVYDQTIAFYRKGVDITELRLQGRIGSGLDVGRAQSQLAGAEAALLDIQAQRAVAIHAIATLIGVPAGTLELPPQQNARFVLPKIPVGVPSDLLERRPDVASAERAMAAANEEIGVTRAAFYPHISLGGTVGLLTDGFDVFSLPDLTWAVGATVAQPLFEGGLLKAELQVAHSTYRQAVDNYRGVVLAAMEQTEDGLSNVALLRAELARDRDAVAAAGRVQDLALQLYQAGADSYLDVVVSQVAALGSGVTEVEIATRTLQSAVALVRALGGGWSRAQLPSQQSIPPFHPLSLG